MQQLVVQAVREGGGQALKFNNRFMIGVCDLLLKLPGYEPMMLECKKIDLTRRTIEAGHVWDLGCTKKQKDFLRDWHEAGMLTGVVSFIQEPGRGVASLRMAVLYYAAIRATWKTMASGHVPLGEKSERLTNMREQLMRFANG